MLLTCAGHQEQSEPLHEHDTIAAWAALGALGDWSIALSSLTAAETAVAAGGILKHTQLLPKYRHRKIDSNEEHRRTLPGGV